VNYEISDPHKSARDYQYFRKLSHYNIIERLSTEHYPCKSFDTRHAMNIGKVHHKDDNAVEITFRKHPKLFDSMS
jgi:hypothetical protein